MNDKYSLAKGEQYGRRLAARLCDQYFLPQPTAHLDGPALLKFTAIRQINLLVLRQLLGQWQQEAARLRSPYFNFEAEPVQAALTQFMNVLSRHIFLARPAFEPLLAAAITNTLRLAADPIGAFIALFLDNSQPLTLEKLRTSLRYIDQNKEFYQSFLDSLSVASDLTPDFLRQRFERYHTANCPTQPALPRLVEELSILLPVNMADLLEDAPAKPAPAPAPVAPSFVSEPARPAAAPSTPTAPSAAPAVATPLQEKLKATQSAAPSLADTLRAGAAPARLADRGNPKVETLREAISINQRFSFINELFNGENMEYHAAIQHLDSLPTAAEAQAYVTGELSQRHDWSRKEEHVGRLLKLIERKFA